MKILLYLCTRFLYHVIMSIPLNTTEIATLRSRVAEQFGSTPSSPKGSDDLSLAVWEKCHEIISSTTLKRLWGYVNAGETVRQSSLDILTHYINYKDWTAFLVDMQQPGNVESHSFNGEGINIEELSKDDLIAVTWQPDRRCVFKYQGNGAFVVTRSCHSKLRVGDTFLTACFIVGEPLYLDNLKQKGTETTTSYIAGSKHGLTSVERL